MKLRAPPGCTCISHKGRLLVVAADRSLEVEDHVAAALAAHGFIRWEDAGAAPIDRDIADENAATDEDAAPQDVSLQDVSSRDAADDVDGLNRPQLFALLREKGVRVALPITNAELRAAARRALAQS